MECKIAVNSQNELGEGPVWDQDENVLYWVDIKKQLLQRWFYSTTKVNIWKMPSAIGSLAIRKPGVSVVALRKSLAYFDMENGSIEPICDIETKLPFTRFNDGKCDRHGRFWAGTMDGDSTKRRGALYRLDVDEICIKVRGDVGTSNGLGWSPDNKIFYYTDSSTHTIYAYDFDLESGEISKERVFAKTPENYVPDGLTVDADGYIWSAMWDGWKIIRFSPSGNIDTEIQLPVQRPTSCTFGGPDLNKLFVTSARVDLTPEELQQQPLAGNIFALDTKVVGLPEPRYGG
jgi:sugar lactone lactonase YvrE